MHEKYTLIITEPVNIYYNLIYLIKKNLLKTFLWIMRKNTVNYNTIYPNIHNLFSKMLSQCYRIVLGIQNYASVAYYYIVYLAYY